MSLQLFYSFLSFHILYDSIVKNTRIHILLDENTSLQKQTKKPHP